MKTFLLFLLSPLFFFAQEQKVTATGIPVVFTEMQFAGGNLYVLNNDGELYQWQASDNAKNLVADAVSAISQNRKGDFVYVKNGLIHNGDVTVKCGCGALKVYVLRFDSDDNPVLLTPNGICYKEVFYKPDYSIDVWGMGIAHKELDMPEVAFVDSREILWLGYDRGGFGGGVAYFNLTTLEFSTSKNTSAGDQDYDYLLANYKFPAKGSGKRQRRQNKLRTSQGKGYAMALADIPGNQLNVNNKGIAEDNNGNYIFSESTRRLELDGSITVFEKNDDGSYTGIALNNLFKYTTTKTNRQAQLQEYIGPVAYNKFDRHFYYYTNNGFFKINRDKKGKYSSTLVVKPKRNTLYAEAYRAGNDINVKQFVFTDAKSFYFITEDMIGYYNGTETVYYK